MQSNDSDHMFWVLSDGASAIYLPLFDYASSLQNGGNGQHFGQLNLFDDNLEQLIIIAHLEMLCYELAQEFTRIGG